MRSWDWIPIAALGAGLAWGHGTPGAPAPEAEQQEWGIAGDRAAVIRSVTVRMLDAMRLALQPPWRVRVRLSPGRALPSRHDRGPDGERALIIAKVPTQGVSSCASEGFFH